MQGNSDHNQESAADAAAFGGRDARLTTAGLAVLLGLIAVGAFFRFWRLGELGLIVDEGYQATAVAAILKHGFPLLDTGFVYSRSIVFQYIQAAASTLLGFNEFALRLPAAVFGVLGIPLAYWFGKSFFNARVGLVLAAFVALSAWQIEYARYARFYTLFQGLYLVGLVAWFRGFMQMKTGWRFVFVAVFLSILTVHHLAVMLGLCFLVIIPLRGYSLARKVVYFGLAGVCGVVWKVWDRVEGRVQFNLGSAEPWGAATTETALASGPLGLPAMRLPEWRFVEVAWEHHSAWLIGGAVAAAVVSATIGHFAVRGKSMSGFAADGERVVAASEGMLSRWCRAAVLVAIVWCAVFNVVALAMLLAAAYLALFVRRWGQLVQLEVLIAAVAAGAATMGWIVWFKFSPRASLTEGLAAMLAFPGLYEYWFHWMVYGWPVMLGLLGLAFVVLCRRAVTPDDRGNAAWFLLGAAIIPAVVTAQLAWKFSESRYFFHLYPIMLTGLAVLTVAVADEVAKRFAGAENVRGNLAVTGVVALVVLIIAQDTNGLKAWDVSSRTYTSYRDPIRSVLNFKWHADFHQDLKTASEAARERLGSDDVVVVVGPPHQAVTYEHYLGNIDYIVTNYDPYLTLVQQEDGFWLDLKSGGRLITRASELAALRDGLDDGRRLWLFSDRRITLTECWYLSNAEKPLERMVQDWMAETEPVFVGHDKITTVHVFGHTVGVDHPGEEHGSDTE
ncbi:MAG: glycosyltransferase family 39 protein [Planctomycetota bacterium]